MADQEETALNPFEARVIGFVSTDGSLVEGDPQGSYSDLLINMGAEDEVRQNSRVLVFALGPEMKDPDSGESLGHFEVVRGEGRVESVQTRMAVVRSSLTRTVTFPKPMNRTAMIAGLPQEVGERTERAPFRSPKIGDLVRFI